MTFKKYLYLIFFIYLSIFISGSFVSAQQYLASNFTWGQNLTAVAGSSLALGDIDNDGDLDLALTGEDGYDNLIFKIYINNGTTLTENQIWQANLTGIREGSIAFGDVDNNDNLDLVAIGCDTGKVGTGCSSYVTKIYTNNGSTFIEDITWQQNFSSLGYKTLGIGDLDNDGDLDLAMSGGDNDFSIYLNNGTVFIEDNSWSQNIRNDLNNKELYRGGIAFTDIDADLDIDMVLSGLAQVSLTRVYINNGTTLTRSTEWDNDLESLQYSSFAFGDFDNNAIIDLVLMGFSDSTNIYLNNGSTFVDNQSENMGTMAGMYDGGIAWGDYDNDGDLDLSQSGQPGYNRIYLNNNTKFENIADEENVTDLDSNIGVVTWADVDNDGDLDHVISGWVTTFINIYINNLTTPNIAPIPPVSFSSSYNNREMKIGWLNGSDNETSVNGLYYNLMVGDSSNNHSIISGIYGGSSNPTAGYFGNMMQRKNLTLKVDRLSPSTTYNWYVQTIDTGLKAGNWSGMQTFTTPTDMTKPNITLNSPIDNFNSSSAIITINTTVFDNMNLTNVSLWGNWTGGWVVNITNTSGRNNTDYIFNVNLTGYADGYYRWMIVARDNATNVENSSVRVFMLDTSYPNVSISLVNNSNWSDNSLDINYSVADNLVLRSCWYSNDSMTLNSSIACGINITNITWSEGQHNLTIWVNDSAGNLNSTRVTFTIDSLNPGLSIIYPLNNTSYPFVGLNINYSASDLNLGNCWYSNDSMTLNSSIGCAVNITNVTWQEGQHNVSIWVNDSSGNINSSQVMFRIDTVAPNITIFGISNYTNSSNNGLDINYSVSDVNLDSCWFSNDTMTLNSSIGCGVNITNLTWTEGLHNITIWANDSIGNESSESVVFRIDAVKPGVLITSPLNNTNWTDNSLDINYSVNDLNLGNCWYSNDSMSVNYSIGCNINITNVSWSEGQHNLSIWVNDSAGNLNYTGVRFMIDTGYPNVSLISPVNGSVWTSSSTVTFSYNVSDVDIANCSLIIDGAVDQTNSVIIEDTSQTFSKSLDNSVHNWSVNCSDYVGYSNGSLTWNFTLSYTAPAVSSGGGGGGGRTTNFWSQTFIINNEDFEKGFAKELAEGERVKVIINNENHYIGIVKLTETSIIINVSSRTQQAVLEIGDLKKFDVSEDGYYDLSVKLNSIEDNKANLTIKSIKEKNAEEDESIGGDEEINSDEIEEEELKEEKGKVGTWVKLAIGVSLVGGLIVFWFLRDRLKVKKIEELRKKEGMGNVGKKVKGVGKKINKNKMKNGSNKN